jgi:hypothetical protein
MYKLLVSMYRKDKPNPLICQISRDVNLTTQKGTQVQTRLKMSLAIIKPKSLKRSLNLKMKFSKNRSIKG